MSAPSSERSWPASRRRINPSSSSAGRSPIVFNLKPAKLMGIESNGMVLAASVDGGKPILVAFDETGASGARVR